MKPYLITTLCVFIAGIPPALDAQPAWTDGQPVEKRPPEKKDDKPAFPEQTRAPYHASAAFQVTTLIDNLARALEPRVPAGWKDSSHGKAPRKHTTFSTRKACSQNRWLV